MAAGAGIGQKYWQGSVVTTNAVTVTSGGTQLIAAGSDRIRVHIINEGAYPVELVAASDDTYGTGWPLSMKPASGYNGGNVMRLECAPNAALWGITDTASVDVRVLVESE